MTFKASGGPNRLGVYPGEDRALLTNSTGAAVVRGDVGVLDFSTASASTAWMPTGVIKAATAVAGLMRTSVACWAEESIASAGTGWWRFTGIMDVLFDANGAAAGADMALANGAYSVTDTVGVGFKVVAKALQTTAADTVGKAMVDGWNGFGNTIDQ